MKKVFFSFALALVFMGTGSAALAYEIPLPVITHDAVSQGSGEVDLSRASVVEGTVTVDSVASGSVSWITAGDLAQGQAGYGFLVLDNMIYAVSNTGDFAYRMPLAFVRPGYTVKVRAAYTPNDGIRLDTWATEQYSRGIIQGFLPGTFYRGLGAFNASVKGPVNLTVGSWSYTQ